MPQQLQRAMAAEAEAAREARAKVIAAEGEHKSSRALAHAAEIISQTPAALQVRPNKKSFCVKYQGVPQLYMDLYCFQNVEGDCLVS